MRAAAPGADKEFPAPDKKTESEGERDEPACARASLSFSLLVRTDILRGAVLRARSRITGTSFESHNCHTSEADSAPRYYIRYILRASVFFLLCRRLFLPRI